ncbi:hypothetical protein pEaSNUABM9_00272 [Erwinia phage pEa_SNUABM_9]|nr:hypothetical protein pEaSNUABM9_00272 [Erwinia phage pEa_SNUABM_9]
MASVRSVPHSTGSRFTFAVKRFGFVRRPGWKVVRVAGTFWQLPPGIEKYLTIEQIQTFVKGADSSQRYSWSSAALPRGKSKTTNATTRGVYWTGQKAFQVDMECAKCVVTPFNEEIDGDIMTGIAVQFPDSPEDDYVLGTVKDVTIATFYKYLLFYNRHVYWHNVQGEGYNRMNLPYGRNGRLLGCSILNSKNTPLPCVTAPPNTTPPSQMSLVL